MTNFKQELKALTAYVVIVVLTLLFIFAASNLELFISYVIG